MLENLKKAKNVKIYTLLEDTAGYNTFYKAQHGVSFLLESKINGSQERILFDTGSHSEPVIHNMDLLDIEPESIDTIVLSHSHFDHTGGLKEIMKKINKETPIIAHPNIFKKSFSVNPKFRYIGVPPLRGGTKEEIEKIGGGMDTLKRSD